MIDTIQILILIPFLSGVLSRLLIPPVVIAVVVAVAISFVLSATRIGLVGIQSYQPFADNFAGIAFTVGINAAFAVCGVRTTSAFYSGLRETSDLHNKPALDNP
ncbi:MAG: hypothetical protein P1U86_18675 [Verrucomicrobiales bacterium]|nr:hypothetical protein [Verrucomicrobiales bacterium]